ncbi:GntR family transcriptional regulator [Microbacterium jejuense]|uniref:GntR family transcriptional regulator n=1 Tax=Microbacterium jejuense TaxID=1263637 RepID=UPI0031EB6C1B
MTEQMTPREELTLLRPAPRRMLADEVYEILRESLISQRIPPGARLNLDRLARELHVSNTPVRQALSRLEADGLVQKEPYVGFTASPLLDSRTIEQLYDLRLLIEPTNAERAASAVAREGVDELTAICVGADALLAESSAEHAEALGAADMEFHVSIARSAGNDVITAHLHEVLTQMSRYTLYTSDDAAHLAWAEHRTILDAIDASDSGAATEAMRQHLRRGLHRVQDLVN